MNSKLSIDISDYLKHEKKISALALSNYLIETQGYSNNLFSTGRPKIYVNVLSYLDKLERQGLIKSINKDVFDCNYVLLLSDQLDEVDTIDKVTHENEVDLKIDTQLSLF
ncbi:DUF3895 domain-containing protein (plasmid) [Metabacillus halosaccharovorans]|uniref:DUF3895 domain-containing protein n=1 Tax=Metabacillus halosaccharovorans TaxID=930124 RepID=UPI0034CDD4BE